MSDQERDCVNPNPKPIQPQKPPDPILKYFRYDHLPPFLASVSKPFCDLALSIAGRMPEGQRGVCDVLPEGPERTVALRKLLEAKDAAVRTLV